MSVEQKRLERNDNTEGLPVICGEEVETKKESEPETVPILEKVETQVFYNSNWSRGLSAEECENLLLKYKSCTENGAEYGHDRSSQRSWVQKYGRLSWLISDEEENKPRSSSETDVSCHPSTQEKNKVAGACHMTVLDNGDDHASSSEGTEPLGKSGAQLDKGTVKTFHLPRMISGTSNKISQKYNSFRTDETEGYTPNDCTERKESVSSDASSGSTLSQEREAESHIKSSGNTVLESKTQKHKTTPERDKCISQRKEKSKVQQSDDRKSKNKTSKSKITPLFVKFAESVKYNIDMFGYFKQRLPDGISFQVINKKIDQNTGNTLVTLQCASCRTAIHLKKELERSNAKCETKLSCFDSMEEASNQVMVTKQKMDKILDRCVEEMLERASAALKKHHSKICDVEENIKKLTITKSKFQSLENYYMMAQERRALEDKLNELNLQMREFKKFISSAHEKFVEMRDSPACENFANVVMKEFGLECFRLDQALPMYARRSDVIDVVKNNQVSVIIGETGSGKSTQMAQYLYQTGFANSGMIVCTQPRKIAAISVATHVANEMASSVGQLIGYKVGMQEKKTSLTRVIYMTDHVLLKECLHDRLLSSFSCIIIDEAHERSIYTDLLLGMIKSCLEKRKDLRVVITSATIDPDVFVKYFGDCPVLSVSGRMFPVDIEWKDPDSNKESFTNYVDESVKKAEEVHFNQPAGDILVFLTSPVETEKCCEKFVDHLEGKPKDYVCLQLHGKLQADEQRKVFEPVPPGRRKIVFATNSAETSVTIPGIRYVIDTGLVKEMNYDPKRKINTLAVSTVTKSSADQRKGRAGRTAPRVCYRLYTELEYDKMTKNMVPEILRVNLNHAMLKLIELDIDPLEFDFVMSPPVDSMECSVEALEELGAIKQRKITDLGKWIAKLPLDPKFSALVYDTLEIGAGLEGMVIAAACSGGSLFYRAGSTEDKEQADRRKIPFCHSDGDLLTMLNVFREWHEQPEKSKGKWCYKHSVNGKAIKGVRDMVNEVITTLKREMKTAVPFRFGDPEIIDPKLIRPLLKTFRGNISHYLGHPKAGYILVTKDQRVEIHPSSALMSLASQPEWLVFDQVMRTSKDFAMNITLISEDLVQKSIEDGMVKCDLEEARSKRIQPVHVEQVGTHLLREIIGPRYTALRTLEAELVDRCSGSVVVLEADRDNLELKIFSKSSNWHLLKEPFEKVIAPLKLHFKAEESEEKLGDRSADRCVRAVVGAGGLTKTIFMPEEFKVVMVHCAVNKKEEMNREIVLEHFTKFGEIQECKKYYHKKKAPSLWGQVTYKNTEDAVKAVTETKGNPDLSARPTIRMSSERYEKFKVKLQWCRRRSRGFGFVSFASIIDADHAVRRGSITVGDSIAKIRPSKSRFENASCQVHVAGLSRMINEDILRESFADRLSLDPDTEINKVAVIREKVPPTTPEMLNTLKRRLCANIESYVTRDAFQLEVRPPVKDTDVNYTAFATFDNPEEGQRVCQAMNHNFILNDEVVSVKPVLHCSLYIPKVIYEKSNEEIAQCIVRLEEDGVRIKEKTLRNENTVIDIHTDDVETLLSTRRLFEDIIRGELVKPDDSQTTKALFTWEGRNKLKHIMQKTETCILLDNRVMTVSIHGPQRNRQKAKQEIDEYLQALTAGNSDMLDLKGEGKPPGVLKAILVKYKVDLSKLREDTGLVSTRVDLRNHRIIIIGSEDAIKNARDKINNIVETLSPEGLSRPNEPECVTCFCPVEQKDLYRVECCGHPYCKECLELQVQSAISSKELPLKCEQEDCSTHFVWKDFLNLSKLGYLKLSDLTNASVSNFVVKNKNGFRFCLTPDCPVVYKVTNTGKAFLCPECDLKICTSCNVQFHEGITCAMFKSTKDEDVTMLQWFAKNKANRKRCPNCAMPIEKNGGCSHVTCLSCKKHICWVCQKFYGTSGDCYGHMEREHGSFM